MPTIHFFLGKGGVGKSTSSTLSALYLSETHRKKVLLVSLDPAHNLSDLFAVKFRDKVTKIHERLFIKEIDEKKRIKGYLKDIESHLVKTYSYQSAFNLQGYFKIIRHAPCIEEHSLLMAFKTILRDYRKMDYLIFDMPPTALTMNFFRLPALSLLWLGKLKELRQDIIDKTEIITKIRFGKREIERDKIMNRLNESIAEYRKIQDIFEDRNRTRLHIVINPDPLSIGESVKINKELREISMKPRDVIINKDNQTVPHNAKKLHIRETRHFPRWHTGLVGFKELREYVAAHGEELSFLRE